MKEISNAGIRWLCSGVGRSIPRVSVFPDEEEAAAWRLKIAGDPLLNITADAIARTYARFTTYNALAEARTTHVAPYVTTASVARDMLEIVKAHGSDKLQYWGFSYVNFYNDSSDSSTLCATYELPVLSQVWDCTRCHVGPPLSYGS